MFNKFLILPGDSSDQTKEMSFPESVLLLDRVDVVELSDDNLDHFRHTRIDVDGERCADDQHK